MEAGRNKIWYKGSLAVRMTPEHRIHAYHAHSTERVHDTALDDEKYNLRNILVEAP